jgi:uncharacterized protein YraI
MRATALLIVLACALLPLGAAAQLDTTRRAATVRAGPDQVFPQVIRLPIASNLNVIGCTANREWCDILSGRTRGWVPVGDITPSSRLRDAPTVKFAVEDYWNEHYRRRPWFTNKDRWAAWGTPGFVPPAAR